MGNTLELDVISDPVCPWCYVGMKRLEQALADYGPEKVDVVWRPYQLDPTIPRDGMDRKAYMEKKFGDVNRFKEMSQMLVEMGKELGIDFAFEAIKRSPNTLNAHRLIRWARKDSAQNAVVAALFRHYFELGHDIGDTETLVEIANECGLDGDLVRDLLNSDADETEVSQEIQQAQAMGVQGVPTFVANNRLAISGAQDTPVFLKFFAQAAN